MPVITRNFYLTLFLSACIFVAGGLLFQGSEAGAYVVVGLGFFGCLILFNILEDRERRRRRRSGEIPPS